MAKKQSATTFRELLTEIRKGIYRPVYLLMGEEAYYIDALVDFMSEHIIPEEDKDYNFVTFYGVETEVETVISASQRYPMMSDRQLVILKESQSMHRAKTQLEKFVSYLEHPNPTTILVIVYKGETLAATSKLVKSVNKCGGVVFNSPLLRDYEIGGPIKDYCTSRKIGIDEKGVEMLKEFVGTNLSKLFGEIEKIIVASSDAKNLVITPELIERNIGISKDYNNFELTNALAAFDYNKAMRIIDYFTRNPGNNPTTVTTGMLFSFFSKLVIAHFAKDKSDSGLMAELNLKNSYALKDIRQAMRSFNASQSVNAISLLRKFDRESKGVNSYQNERALQRELIFNLFTIR